MSKSKLTQVVDPESVDVRWEDLYRLGSIACIALPVSTALAIAAYFIWPYAPNSTDVESIYSALQGNRLAGLLSLDLSTIVIAPLMVLQILAVYVALKHVNESYALTALVFGLMGTLLVFAARPLAEMSYLSDQFATATSDVARARYLAAGEALNTLSTGTAWAMYNIFVGINYLMSSVLMLRSEDFNKTTAYLGIIIAILGFGTVLGFLVPAIGGFLLLLGTAGGVVWYLLLAKVLHKLGWQKLRSTMG